MPSNLPRDSRRQWLVNSWEKILNNNFILKLSLKCLGKIKIFSDTTGLFASHIFSLRKLLGVIFDHSKKETKKRKTLPRRQRIQPRGEGLAISKAPKLDGRCKQPETEGCRLSELPWKINLVGLTKCNCTLRLLKFKLPTGTKKNTQVRKWGNFLQKSFQERKCYHSIYNWLIVNSIYTIMIKCEHDLIQNFYLINFSKEEIKGYEKANT